ncbi:hypothetical protein R8Z57_15840 [Microbacterium sp. M3]|uniref:DUF3137 domain-containing protein n=1 Tax=Microbacterium arthrosphaerae TaxID=792652 RepID=A0ABU4H6B5_9MICO|nr:MULTISPECIES: hypothetical protein [Microbacterium]MDW4574252.1 hypothetical protein [Microbacterium arthrosphaerae]MDW7608107.1 hypothetical protein [Microbacterium sp. M3]
MSVPSAASGPAPSYPFDARPLIEPVDPAAARAFARELKRTGRLPQATVGGIIVVVIALAIFLGFGTAVFTVLGATIGMVVSSAGGDALGTLFVFIPPLVIGGIIALVAVAMVRGARSRDVRMLRLDRFARANAMQYVPQLPAPGLPGMIFSIGSSRQSTDLVRGDRPRFVEFANYRYTTGSGKNQQTHEWGYVAVKLDTPLPHIVLDATSNNSLFSSNLPLSFDKDQRLSLEGDFDRYFSLYCPTDYERDALYLFTPDIMARFIDNAAALDVEIVDDWLFLYAKRDFSTLDPQTWAWLFSVVGALLDKFAQWARWRDERLATATGGIPDASALGSGPAPAGAGAAPGGAPSAAVPFAPPLASLRPPPGVAPQGRRLERGVPWVPIIVGGVIALFWVLSNTGVLALIFGG